MAGSAEPPLPSHIPGTARFLYLPDPATQEGIRLTQQAFSQQLVLSRG